MMDVFKFCWTSLLNEWKISDTSFDTNACQIGDNNDVDFSIASNRLAYMYKYGSVNILHFQECISGFFTKFSVGKEILNGMCSKERLKISSLSCGPGIDVVGLLLALSKHDKTGKIIFYVDLINKYASWENLFCHMLYDTSKIKNSSINVAPENSKIIVCDILSSISMEAQRSLEETDVVLMVKSFASKLVTGDTFLSSLKRILSLLKPGTTVFFVDRKKRCDKFVAVSNCGKVLYGPAKVDLKKLSFNKEVCKLVGSAPLITATAYFVAWKKNAASFDIKCGDSVTNVQSLLSFCSLNENRLKSTHSSSKENVVADINAYSALCADSECSLIRKDLSKSTSASNKNAFELIQKENFKQRYENLLKRCENLVSKLDEMVVGIQMTNEEFCQHRCHCKKKVCYSESAYHSHEIASNSDVRKNVCKSKKLHNENDTSFILNQGIPYIVVPLETSSLSNLISALI